MPTSRHRTVIQVDVDDRKIRGLDRTLHRAFDDQMLVSFERVLDRSARTLEAMAKAAERFEKTMQAAGGAGGAGGASALAGRAGGGRRGDQDLQRAVVALTRQIQQLNQRGGGGGGGGGAPAGGGGPGFWNRTASTALGSYLGNTASSMGGEGFMAQAMGGIPIVGGFVRGAINSIHNYANQYAQAQISSSRQMGTLGRRTPGSRAFTSFGFSAPEAMGQAAQFASGAGRSGAGANAGLMDAALQMQMFGGIREGTGVMRAAEVGLSSSERQEANRTGQFRMFEAVSGGIRAGIREARLGQFIGVATQVLEQGRLEGADLRLQAVLRTMTGFAGLGAGFRGEQGMQAGQTAIGALRNFRPQQDVASLVGLRAVGFGTAGGPSYHEALSMFQQNPERVMPQLLRTIRGMAPGNADAQVELMMDVGERLMGFRPTVQQARSMVAGDLSAFGQQVGTEEGVGFLGRRQAQLGAGFGVAGREAGLTNQRIGIGGQVYGVSRRMQQTEIGMLGQILPQVGQMITSFLNGIREAIAAFQEGGVQGFMTWLFEGIGDLAREAATSAVEEITGVDTEEASRRVTAMMENPADVARSLAVQAGGGMQEFLNETAAVTSEALGADLETSNQFRRTAASGRRMRERAAAEMPGAAAPTDLEGNLRDGAAALNRAADAAAQQGAITPGALVQE